MDDDNRFEKVKREFRERLREHNTAYINRRRAEFEQLFNDAKLADDEMDGRKRRKKNRRSG